MVTETTPISREAELMSDQWCASYKYRCCWLLCGVWAGGWSQVAAMLEMG